MNNSKNLNRLDKKKSHKWIGIILTFLIIGIVGFAIYFGLNEYMTNRTYTIHWGSLSIGVEVKEDENIPFPETPVKTGYVFAGWYIDEDEFTEEYWNDFKKENLFNKYARVRVYEKWVEKEGSIEIYSAEDLKNLDSNGEYILMNDIVLDYNNGRYDIGGFTGVFDGNGYTISNLKEPLFAYNSGTIKNLGIKNASVDSHAYSEQAFGILVDNNSGTISNCFVSSSSLKIMEVDDGKATVGVLVGVNTGIVEQCYVDEKCGILITYGYHYGGYSSDYSAFGGLIGKNSGTVDLCHTDVVMETWYSKKGYSGGLVGLNNGSIKRSYSTGSVNGGEYVGGLVGSNKGMVLYAYATPTVIASGTAGGLIGINDCDTEIVANSYSLSSVSASGCVGGFIGKNNSGCIANCYSLSSMYTTEKAVDFVQDNAGEIVNCYQNESTTTNNCAQVASTQQLQDKAWIETNLWKVEIDIWNFTDVNPTINTDFKVSTIEISKKEDLIKLQGAVLSCDYEITSNIDLNGSEWSPILCNIGTIGGNNFTISNFKLSRLSTNNVGFIANNIGNLERISINNCSFDIETNDGLCLGILVSNNDKGSISSCSINSTVNVVYTGDDTFYISGMVGYNNEGKISDCFADVPISVVVQKDSYIYIGGVAGINSKDGIICRSSYTGNIFVEAKEEDTPIAIGGIAAANMGEIDNGYAMSIINIVSLDSSYTNIGMLAGGNSGMISNSSTIGTLKFEIGFNYNGEDGLVDTNSGTISNCDGLVDIVK